MVQDPKLWASGNSAPDENPPALLTFQEAITPGAIHPE
jgi:hypothetical protein